MASKSELSSKIASQWPDLHQPVVPFHLHKGVGWTGEENPCICNHLMQPMTTTGYPALPTAVPPSLDEAGVRLNTHNSQSRLTSRSIPARTECPLSADPSKLPQSPESLRQSDDPHWTPHPCQGQPHGVPTNQCSHSLTTPQDSLTPIRQPTQGHSPHHCPATTAAPGTKMPPSHSTLAAPD